MNRLIQLLNIAIFLLATSAFAADYDGDKKVDELSGHAGSVASTTKILIPDPSDTDIITTATFQELVTAVVGASYDTSAELDALFTAQVPDSLFNAHTIIYATTDNTPAALTVTEGTVVGRLSGGNISAIAIGTSAGNVAAGDHNHSGVYLESESDSVVGAITGIVMADGGGNISAAAAGTDYVAVDDDLTDLADGSLSGSKIGISGTTVETNIAADDLVLIYDTSATANRAMTRGNFLTGLGVGQAIILDFADDGSNESTDLGEIAITNDTNSIFTEPLADKLSIDVSKNWPTADTANAGDSATAFFSAGTIEHERGGFEADVSAYDGLVKISSGSTSAVTITSAGEAILDDASAGDQLTTLGAQASDADLATLASPTAWRVFYSNGSSAITEVALGINGTFFESNGADQIPAFRALEAADIPDISSTYEVVDADILRTDTADTIGADFEWQDGIPISIGNDNDWEVAYDETTDDRLEFVHTAGAGADVLFDLNDNAADSTFTISNSDGSNVANLVVEGTITSGGTEVQTQHAYLTDIVGLSGLSTGDILIYNDGNISVFEPGDSGNFLQSQGDGYLPQWASSTATGINETYGSSWSAKTDAPQKDDIYVYLHDIDSDDDGDADDLQVTANNSTDETVYPVFVDGATGTQGLESDTGLSYNPSSGALTVASIATSVADGGRYISAPNTVAITATATAGALAYTSDTLARLYIADGNDWNDYVISKELIDTSSEIAAIVGDETGTGILVLATSPTLVTPTLGVATATSVNKVAITAPASAATLTLSDGSSLITSGGHSITLTSTATTDVTLPTTGTLATVGGALGEATATSIQFGEASSLIDINGDTALIDETESGGNVNLTGGGSWQVGGVDVALSTDINTFDATAPGAIGGTTPAAGTFTALEATTGLTVTGDITATAGNVDFDLDDDAASALSFDAAGKEGILNIITTDDSEGVSMSGTLAVTGNVTSSGTVTATSFTSSAVDGSRFVHAPNSEALDTIGDNASLTEGALAFDGGDTGLWSVYDATGDDWDNYLLTHESAWSDMPALTATYMVVGNGDGAATAVEITGVLDITNAGVTSFANDSIVFAAIDDDGNFGPFTGAWDWTGGSVEIPNGTDPDVDAAGEIAFDTDDNVLRGYDGAAQFALGRKIEAIHVTVVTPQDLDDGERDAFMFWSNESGMSFVVTGWKGWAGTDDTTLNIEETDADGQNNATVDAVEIATDGTGLFYASDSTITAATIENGHLLFLDFDDTDDPDYVKMTIYGYYNADVD